MKYKKLCGVMATIIAALVLQARADQNSTPVGYTTITVPGNSDVLVSKPFDNATSPKTLDEMFPASRVGTSFLKTTSTLSRKTEVLQLAYNTIGQNKSADALYYFFNDAWRKVGQPITDNWGSSNLVNATSYVILRNKNNANPLTYIAAGTVNQQALTNVVTASATETNDVYVATGRGVVMKLDELGLGGTPAFQSTTSALSVKDRLLVFDNAQAVQNKSASAIYYYISSGGNIGWRKSGEANTLDFGSSNVLESAAGFIVRRFPGSTGNFTQITPFSN